MEHAVDVQGRDVFDHVEGVSYVCGVEDEVEGVLPRLVPVGFGSDDEVLSATFDGIFFLVWRMGEGVDVGAESTSKLKAQVTETATADQ